MEFYKLKEEDFRNFEGDTDLELIYRKLSDYIAGHQLSPEGSKLIEILRT